MKTCISEPLNAIRTLFLLLFLTGISNVSYCQTEEIFTTSQSWVCPTGVTSVVVECWGGGGAGGSGRGNSTYGVRAYPGGGGGGAYAKSTIAVTPGYSYTITVGAGGITSATHNGVGNGADTSFKYLTTTHVLAKGGLGAPTVINNGSTNLTSNGGAGGLSTSSTGTIKYSGGGGAAGVVGTGGGGGGSSAGTAGNGNAASTKTGGTAPTGGSAGGNGGGSSGSNGTNATGFSGGGGGAWAGTGAELKTGGNGADGKVVLTYTLPAVPAISVHPSASAQNVCVNGSFTTLTITASSVTTYQWYKNSSPSNSGGTTIGTNSSSYTPLSNSAGVSYYYCVVSNASGSVTSNVSGAFTVTTAPNAGVLSGTQNICSNGTTTFTTNGNTGGVWSSGTPTAATIHSSTGEITPVGAGSSTITYTVTGTGGCNNASSTRMVTVTTAPNAGVLSGTQNICSNGTTTFTTNGNTGGVWSSGTPTVATIHSSTGEITPVGAGSSTITYTVTGTGGCSNASNTRMVTVTTTPQPPTLGSLIHPSCANSSGSFEIINYDSSYSYSITPSIGVTHSGNIVTAPGANYTVTATLNTCTSVASNLVVMNPQPVNIWDGSGWSLGSSPINEDQVVFNGDFSSTTDLHGCSVQVNSGTVVMNAGNTMTIIKDVKVTGGTLTFENNASLLQENPSAVNSGNITYKRRTTPLKQWDFTYWSSPVTNATLSQLATNYDFYSFNPSINNWVYQLGSNSMLPGTGYIGRNGSNPSPLGLTTSFVGVPNNGNISAPIIKSLGTLNLIGNPYPSAIDIDLFLRDSANNTIVNGTVFIWTHNSVITNNTYSLDDYAKYNLTGGVRAISGGPIPTGIVAAGQGFFIEANPALANGNYNATFNNNMRVGTNNDQFFRISNSENNTSSYSANLERNRLWLSLSNSQGAYNQMLLGYIQDATNEYDTLFDGKTLPSGNTVSIYTMVGTENLSIQGKALPFSSDDVVPVAYSTTLNGLVTISLDNFDGIFENQAVYLLDKYLNVYHNIKNSSYTFNTVSGTFTDRFEIRYSTNALGVTALDLDINSIKIISNNNELTILSSVGNIDKVVIFDILGKVIYQNSNNLVNTEFQSGKLNISNQIVLVKITLNNGKVISKKVII